MFVLYLMGLMGGIICGGNILRGHGRMKGPRGPMDGAMGGATGARCPRALGPPGNNGGTPLSRETGLGDCGGGGGGGSGILCLGSLRLNMRFNGGIRRIRGGDGIRGGSGIRCGMPVMAGLPPNLGGGSGRAPAGNILDPRGDPRFSGLILLLLSRRKYSLPPLPRKHDNATG